MSPTKLRKVVNSKSVEKGLYDAILVVFGGAAGGVAYASLAEPAGVRVAVTIVLIGMVGAVAAYMNHRWHLD